MDFSRFLQGFFKIDTWVSLRGYMDLSKLLHGFGQKLFHGFVKILVLFFSRPLPNKTKLKFDQDFKPSASN